MRIRTLFIMIFVIAMASLCCDAQQLIRPNLPSTEGKNALREILQGASLTKGDAENATVSDYVLQALESDPAIKGVGSRGFTNQALQTLPAAVRHDSSTGSVRIKANHKNLKYEEGELMQLEITSDISGVVFLVNLQPDGQYKVLFPNEFDNENQIEPGKTVHYPSPNVKKSYQVPAGAPFGEDRILAIVSKKDLDVKQLEDPSFYETRGLLQSQQGAKGFSNVPTDDFPCHTITVTTYPKGQSPEPRPKQRLAFIFGANIYQIEGLHPLQACKNDVKLMEALFTEFGHIDALGSLTGEEMTKENVRKAFDLLIANSHKGDEIFIIWTGHGGSFADTSGNQPTGRTQYLVLYDSKPNDHSTVLTDVEFEHWLDDLSGCRIAIFLDTCYSGGMIDGIPNTKSMEDDEKSDFFANKFARHSDATGTKDIRPDQAAVLCASQVGQQSVVRKDIPVSAMIWCMTKFIIEQKDCTVSFDDICKYVEKNVPLVVEEQFNGRKQKPVWMNEIGTILVKP